MLRVTMVDACDLPAGSRLRACRTLFCGLTTTEAKVVIRQRATGAVE